MNPMQTIAKSTVSHRLATALRVGCDRLGFATTPIDNEKLIYWGSGSARRHANTRPGQDGNVVIPRRLNAFFAISVNSPSLSMVNFSCCVGSAPNTGARGVIRRVTPQPMRAAVRMEAGADACL